MRALEHETGTLGKKFFGCEGNIFVGMPAVQQLVVREVGTGRSSGAGPPG